MTSAVVPQKMLAWQKHLPSKTPIRVEVDVPVPKQDEILVKIRAAGVCHSDYGLKEMDTLPAEFLQGRSEFTFGHEGCGEVVSTGTEVTQFKPGDAVAMFCVPGCGSASCRECSAGVPQICQKGPRYGGGQDSFFAPFAVVRESAAVKIPTGVSAAAGAVATDACMTAYHAVVQRARVKKDDIVLIIGLGGLGFNALQIALSIGARPIVVDQRQSILDEARAFGVGSEDIVPVDTDISDWFRQKNLQVDKVIDFVAVQTTFEAAVNSVRPAGTVVVVGLLGRELKLSSPTIVRRQLNILGSYAGTHADVEACLHLISTGALVPQVAEESMVNFPTVLEDLHCGKIKGRVVLIP